MTGYRQHVRPPCGPEPYTAALQLERAEGGELVRDQDVEEPAAQRAEDRLDLMQAPGHPDDLGDLGRERSGPPRMPRDIRGKEKNEFGQTSLHQMEKWWLGLKS